MLERSAVTPAGTASGPGNGLHGRILTIDVTGRSFAIEPTPPAAAALLGGKGLATRLLYDRNPPGVDPFHPDNHIIFATGPLAQSPAWGGCRYGVFTKSPLTGLYAESYAGGKAPEAIDAAGFDAVLVRGRSARPVVLSVHPDGVDFHDAGELWGMDAYQAEDLALERFADRKPGFRRPGALVIGPAGENLVRLALIGNDHWRCAGRTGTGAVLGAKRVKAIVFQGDRRRPLHDPEAAKTLAKEFHGRWSGSPATKAYRAQGTTMMVAIMNTAGTFPTRYWSEGRLEGWEAIGGEAFHRDFDVKPHACLKCFMACGRLATVREGRHAGLTIEGPEYETIYAFGGLCMVRDMAEIIYLNDLCDRLGIDTISAGNLCAFAIEAHRRGKLDYAVDYGQVEPIAELLRLMAMREGVGELLSQGIVAASTALGLEDLAIHVKGLEPPGYDPRVLKGMGLTYATSDRGACHLRTTFYKPELSGMIKPDIVEGKAELLTDFEDRLTIFDTLVLCRFYRDFYSWDELAALLPLVTGREASKETLRGLASRITDLTRAFNLREGMDPSQDKLPKRLHREALPSGHTITEDDMARMLADYYRLRGWDESGRLKHPIPA